MFIRSATQPSSSAAHVSAAESVASGSAARNARQNWILDPFQDALFVIVAPVLVLLAAIALFKTMGGVTAASLIVVAHIVITVAHHLPTFIRIYGDVELFQRFKWNFVLAPVIPLLFSAGVLGYINYMDYPVEYFLYLYLMLALWDPWHFLRQHYGFMRIYDRPNAAPRRIAANMDLALSVVWFVFIMLASGAWLADYLEGLYESARIPALSLLPAGAAATLTNLARDIALLTTLVYAGYLVWCRQKGYFISGAKVALCLTTFGVMYLAYTPNPWILKIAPEWTFKVGFAAVGIVHMTQYLAIVWRYNRNLAQKPQRARTGWFQKLHARGGWWIAGAYVVVCLLYGDIITTKQAGRWLMSVLLAIGFTSTLLHYYFDGFIWKIRHQQNQDNLLSTIDMRSAAGDMPRTTTSETQPSAHARSWWTSFRGTSPQVMLARQLVYFGVPMAILTFGAVSVWSAPTTNYVDYMYRAQLLSKQGTPQEVREAAEIAYAAMDEQLAVAERIAELNPTSAREAELAFLVYNHSYYEHVVLPAVAGHQMDSNAAAAHREAASRAADLMKSAIDRGGSLAHPGHDTMTREDGERTLASWRRIGGHG